MNCLVDNYQGDALGWYVGPLRGGRQQSDSLLRKCLKYGHVIYLAAALVRRRKPEQSEHRLKPLLFTGLFNSHPPFDAAEVFRSKSFVIVTDRHAGHRQRTFRELCDLNNELEAKKRELNSTDELLDRSNTDRRTINRILDAKNGQLVKANSLLDRKNNQLQTTNEASRPLSLQEC